MIITSEPGLLNRNPNRKNEGPNPYQMAAAGLLQQVMAQQAQQKALYDQAALANQQEANKGGMNMAQFAQGLAKLKGQMNPSPEKPLTWNNAESPFTSQFPQVETSLPIPKPQASLPQQAPQQRYGMDDVGKAITATPSSWQPQGITGNPYYKQASFYDTIKQSLAPYESGSGGYTAQSPNSSALGKYQFIDSTRESITPGVSREAFMKNPQLQEIAMNKLIDSNISSFRNMGVNPEKVDPDELAGMVWAAHLRGPQAAVSAYKNPNYQGIPDANGTLPRTYYDRGKKLYGQTYSY